MDNSNLENFSGSFELALASCFRELWSAMMLCEEAGTHFRVSGIPLFAATL